MAKSLALINEKSGAVSMLGARDCARAIFDARQDDDLEVEIAGGDPSKLMDDVAKAVNAGEIDRIYAFGGDGTMAALAGVLAGTAVALAPLPGGTLNALSRDLGFHKDLNTAIGQLRSLKKARIDVAYINDIAFLNNVVFGAYTTVAESRERVRSASGIVEKIGALGEVAAAVTHSDLRDYSVKMNGDTISSHSNTLMVSNNVYDGADDLRPVRGRLDTGNLGVYISRSKSPIDFISLLFDAISSGLKNTDIMSLHETSSCSINSKSELLEATVDGEVMELSGPVQLTIKPSALNVLAPM
ncbi:MAG: diacylglycerol kinase family protein [Pseudomonadota bacterium]